MTTGTRSTTNHAIADRHKPNNHTLKINMTQNPDIKGRLFQHWKELTNTGEGEMRKWIHRATRQEGALSLVKGCSPSTTQQSTPTSKYIHLRSTRNKSPALNHMSRIMQRNKGPSPSLACVGCGGALLRRRRRLPGKEKKKR